MQPFQLDQFVWFYRQLGALPTVSVRLFNGSPQTAANLVRYANLEADYGIEYWSIGNEPTLFEEQKNVPYDTERFNREWRAIAEAMKAADPSIKLMGPELHQWNRDLASTLKDSAGRDWMIEFLQANGDLVDVVTVHRYPYWSATNVPATFEQMQASAEAMSAEVAYLRELILEYTGRDLPIAITEINSTPTAVMGQPASPDSHYNAIWYADVLGRLMTADVWMVNQWVISQRSTGLGLINGFTIRPTLYTFQMFKHFGDQQVYAASGAPDVTVYAALRDDGALTVMAINLGDTEQTVTLDLAGASPVEAAVWLLDAAHNAENLGVQPWPADGVVTLPGQSVTLFVMGVFKMG
jgi:alpha-L-arabinofuranosidase